MEVAGLVFGVIPLCVATTCKLRNFISSLDDAPSSIKALAQEVHLLE